MNRRSFLTRAAALAAGLVIRPSARTLASVLPLEVWVEACPNAKIGLGLQGWLKTASDGQGRRLLAPRDWMPPKGVLGAVEVVCLSREDLFGRDALLAALVAESKRVVVTEGAAGCVIYEGGTEVRVARVLVVP